MCCSLFPLILHHFRTFIELLYTLYMAPINISCFKKKTSLFFITFSLSHSSKSSLNSAAESESALSANTPSLFLSYVTSMWERIHNTADIVFGNHLLVACSICSLNMSVCYSFTAAIACIRMFAFLDMVYSFIKHILIYLFRHLYQPLLTFSSYICLFSFTSLSIIYTQ